MHKEKYNNMYIYIVQYRFIRVMCRLPADPLGMISTSHSHLQREGKGGGKDSNKRHQNGWW
jgi:hypothetical protein